MPSPIAHATAGYIVYRLSRKRVSLPAWKRVGPFSPLLILMVAVSLLPDLDAILGVLYRDLGRFHNNGTHSLVTGLIVSLAISLALSWRSRATFSTWFVFIFINYGLHVLLDFFTEGRGVMLFWPISTQRFISPQVLFFGVRWSEGFISFKHLITLANELGFVFLVILASILLSLIAGVSLRRNSPQPSAPTEGDERR